MTPDRPGATLVLALGNDILGDDRIALEAAELLQAGRPPGVQFVYSAEAGFALMEKMTGYRQVLILDSVMTGRHPPGTVLEMNRDDFRKIVAPSPHYAGLPEIFRLADCLDLDMPTELRIVAMEVQDPYQVREQMSAQVRAGLPAFVATAGQVLAGWEETLATA